MSSFQNTTGRSAMEKTQPTSAGQSVHFDAEIEVVLNAIPQPIIIKDTLSRFCFLNDAACALVGRNRGELIGRTDHDILPAAEADRIREVDKQVLSTGREFSFEEEITVTDGTVRHLVTQKRRAGLSSKERLVVATISDVTTRRKALEALEESEARFRAIADDAPVMIWVTDESGSDTYHSRLWLETTGQTAEEAQEFGWADVIHPRIAKKLKTDFRQLFVCDSVSEQNIVSGAPTALGPGSSTSGGHVLPQTVHFLAMSASPWI